MRLDLVSQYRRPRQRRYTQAAASTWKFCTLFKQKKQKKIKHAT